MNIGEQVHFEYSGTTEGDGKLIAKYSDPWRGEPMMIIELPSKEEVRMPEHWVSPKIQENIFMNVIDTFELSKQAREVMDLQGFGGDVSLPLIQSKLHLGYNQAKQVFEELIKVGLISRHHGHGMSKLKTKEEIQKQTQNEKS